MDDVNSVSDSRRVDYLFSTGGPVCQSNYLYVVDACSVNQLHLNDMQLALNNSSSSTVTSSVVYRLRIEQVPWSKPGRSTAAI